MDLLDYAQALHFSTVDQYSGVYPGNQVLVRNCHSSFLFLSLTSIGVHMASTMVLPVLGILGILQFFLHSKV